MKSGTTRKPPLLAARSSARIKEQARLKDAANLPLSDEQEQQVVEVEVEVEEEILDEVGQRKTKRVRKSTGDVNMTGNVNELHVDKIQQQKRSISNLPIEILNEITKVSHIKSPCDTIIITTVIESGTRGSRQSGHREFSTVLPISIPSILVWPQTES
jgi:hypothetical protein